MCVCAEEVIVIAGGDGGMVVFFTVYRKWENGTVSIASSVYTKICEFI